MKMTSILEHHTVPPLSLYAALQLDHPASSIDIQPWGFLLAPPVAGFGEPHCVLFATQLPQATRNLAATLACHARNLLFVLPTADCLRQLPPETNFAALLLSKPPA